MTSESNMVQAAIFESYHTLMFYIYSIFLDRLHANQDLNSVLGTWMAYLKQSLYVIFHAGELMRLNKPWIHERYRLLDEVFMIRVGHIYHLK